MVCGAHLGIIQGALAELGAPVNATRLFPFVEPGLCIATLTRPAGSNEPVHPPIPACPVALLLRADPWIGVPESSIAEKLSASTHLNRGRQEVGSPRA